MLLQSAYTTNSFHEAWPDYFAKATPFHAWSAKKPGSTSLFGLLGPGTSCEHVWTRRDSTRALHRPRTPANQMAAAPKHCSLASSLFAPGGPPFSFRWGGGVVTTPPWSIVPSKAPEPRSFGLQAKRAGLLFVQPSCRNMPGHHITHPPERL